MLFQMPKHVPYPGCGHFLQLRMHRGSHLHRWRFRRRLKSRKVARLLLVLAYRKVELSHAQILCLCIVDILCLCIVEYSCMLNIKFMYMLNIYVLLNMCMLNC